MADHSKASDVAARYAQALYDLAREGDLTAIEADVAALSAMIRDSADLRTLIVSPAFSADQQGRALQALAQEAGFAVTTRKFLGALTANRRTAALGAILSAFQRLLAKGRGSITATVTTALPMSSDQSRTLAAALRLALGKEPVIDSRVDRTILGGLKVQVGSRLYDASLKSKLNSMKFALKRA